MGLVLGDQAWSKNMILQDDFLYWEKTFILSSSFVNLTTPVIT